jgi:hypothetical protein
MLFPYRYNSLRREHQGRWLMPPILGRQLQKQRLMLLPGGPISYESFAIWFGRMREVILRLTASF